MGWLLEGSENGSGAKSSASEGSVRAPCRMMECLRVLEDLSSCVARDTLYGLFIG